MSDKDKGRTFYRREFIKAAGAALLGFFSAGGWLGPGLASAADGKPSDEISKADRKVVEALAETIIPSEGPERPGALDVGLVESLLDRLGQAPGARKVFLGFCWFWEYSPIWSGRWARLSSLDLAERTKILESWESSRVPIKRGALLILKAVIMVSFYNNPVVWPYIGYEPGCLSGPP